MLLTKDVIFPLDYSFLFTFHVLSLLLHSPGSNMVLSRAASELITHWHKESQCSGTTPICMGLQDQMSDYWVLQWRVCLFIL